MNLFLSRFAVKHGKQGLSRTFVLPERSTSKGKIPIAAYYTLAASTIYRAEIPAKESLPRYPLPMVLLARLAVDLKHQGKGLGEKSLIYALRHAVRLCDKGLSAHGLILDVLDEEALRFYQRFNFFHSLSNDPMKLFVQMNALRKI